MKYYGSWREIQQVFPKIAERIKQEYDRCNGFVPYEQGYVYLMQACGTSYFKIGKSVNPDRRLLQVAPQMPFITRFVRVWRSNFMSIAESQMHRHFAKDRANGEWFSLSDEKIADLLSESSPEFEDLIRNAYYSRFMDAICPNWNEQEHFHEWINEATCGRLCLTEGIGNAEEIAWIEDLFGQIQKQEFCIPADLKTSTRIASERRCEAIRRQLTAED